MPVGIKVFIFDINSTIGNDEAKHEFHSVKHASQYLKKLSTEKGIANFYTELTLAYNLSRRCDQDGVLNFPELGVKTWRSFACESCRSGRLFRPMQTICGNCSVRRITGIGYEWAYNGWNTYRI